ncbi:uncharacterized protein LOC141668508 isoform X1 [Apium graveolens]|uniref:uncharacterized protein LOC141668508 isoform X1 n=1 Tax=Apium graveolens TaxID=4045 RepID=UPI003D7A392F
MMKKANQCDKPEKRNTKMLPQVGNRKSPWLNKMQETTDHSVLEMPASVKRKLDLEGPEEGKIMGENEPEAASKDGGSGTQVKRGKAEKTKALIGRGPTTRSRFNSGTSKKQAAEDLTSENDQQVLNEKPGEPPIQLSAPVEAKGSMEAFGLCESAKKKLLFGRLLPLQLQLHRLLQKMSYLRKTFCLILRKRRNQILSLEE